MDLILAPDPWLDRVVMPFDFNLYNAEDLSSEMIEIMETNNGMGLAANQIALDAQIFVMKSYLLNKPTPLTIINPMLVEVSMDTETMPEGCLSHPDLILKIKRPKKVIAKYLDIHAKECIIELFDIDARCFLHEYDHLNGIEFIDRVSKLKLQMARKKQYKRNKSNG